MSIRKPPLWLFVLMFPRKSLSYLYAGRLRLVHQYYCELGSKTPDEILKDLTKTMAELDQLLATNRDLKAELKSKT